MNDNMSNSYLTTMVGKEIRAYKGGPESWHGLLLAVREDFIVLFNEKDGFIYYKTQHIKSVVVDSKTNTMETPNQTNSEDDNEGSFLEILGNLVGEEVKINRGGPESRKGTLLAVAEDHLVVDTEKDGVIYYNLEHIKSVSVKVDEDEMEEGAEDAEEMDGEQTSNFIDADDLEQLFQQMQYSYVMINRGPESFEGVLVDSSDSLLTLVVRDEVLRVSKFHVKSIRQNVKNDENEYTQNSNQNNTQNSNQNNKKKNQNKDKSNSIVTARRQQQNRRRKR